MSNSESKQPPGFLTTFVWPALWIFLIPTLSLAFFIHAQARYDDVFRVAALQQVEADAALDADEKQSLKELYTNVPLSTLLTNPQFAETMPSDVSFPYAIFRWMIRIALGSIVVSILTFLAVGACVLMSMTSQRVQHLLLSMGWNVLRLVGVLQTIAQGAMIIALSYWVTALWFEVFSVKLVLLSSLISIVAVFFVIKGFFTRINNQVEVDGVRIEEPRAKALWQRLRSLCQALNTTPPDSMIAGIDDNFFVTEQPVVVNGTKVKGRTLFVSLPLLKQLKGSEADAVLAHEMAHFSGNDTFYSRKIGPLLQKYGNYLQLLASNTSTLPVYFYMNCFRALFEISLGKTARMREVRADSLAVEQSSPKDLASALLRMVAYSSYRNQVQGELFKQQTVLEDANVCDRIEEGFDAYMREFVNDSRLAELSTSHPFDSHPSIASRLQQFGIPFRKEDLQGLLAEPADGRWYDEIDHADAVERALWDDFEDAFRKAHEQTLPFRFLPSNEMEKEVVERSFPEILYSDKKGNVLTIDYEKIGAVDWEAPIHYREITNCTLNDGTLVIQYERGGKKKQTIQSSKFKKQAGEVLAAFQNYYGRHCAAVAYHQSIATDVSPDGASNNA